MGAVASANIITDGLVACWDAGNRRCGTPSDGGTWNSLGANAPAVLANDAGFADVNMGGLALDGTDEKVTVANTTNIDGDGGFTFDIWLYFLAVPTDNYTIFSLYNGDGGSLHEFMLYIMEVSAYSKSVMVGSRGTNYSALRSDNPAMSPSNNIGKWVHYCATYNGDGENTPTNYKIYFNGQDMGSDGTTQFGAGLNGNVWGIDGSSGDLNGYIGRVAFYNKELTAAQILQNHEATKPRFEPRITKSGLVGNWDAGDPECYVGGTTCKDTANGTTATFKNWDGGNQTTGAANFNSANGGYWEFDGTDQYIQCSTNSVLQPQSFSVEAWAKESTDGGEVLALPIVTWKSGGAKYPAVYTSYHVAKTPIIFLSGSDYREFNNTAVSVAGWHHVMFTYTYDDVSTSAFYVDGVSIASGTTVNGTKDATDVCDIGRADTSLFYKGSIALVRIYDRPLSAAEIMDNFQKTRGRFGV